MFAFFEEYNKIIYDEIINEVNPTLGNKLGFTAILSAIEKIFKLELENNKVYSLGLKFNYTLGDILYEKPPVAFDYIQSRLKLLDSEMRELKTLNRFSNQRKHEISSIYDEAKKYYRLLYKICVKAYRAKFNKEPNTEWDGEYLENLLENDNTELRKQLQEQYKQLQQKDKELNDLKALSMPITRANIKPYIEQQFKKYDYVPQNKIKEIGSESKAKETPRITNQVKLVQISKGFKVNLSTKHTLDMVFDYLSRGWFEEAKTEINRLKEYNGDIAFINFLIKNKCTSINNMRTTLLANSAEQLDFFIANCSSKISLQILNRLTNDFLNERLTLQSARKIFNVLAKYKFTDRPKILEIFKESVISEITSERSVQVDIVLDLLRATESNYDQTHKELLELCLTHKKFNIAEKLINLILDRYPNDIYALTKKLLVYCDCSSEQELPDNLYKLKDITFFENFLHLLAKENGKLFLFYVDIITTYIEQNINNKGIFKFAYQIFEIIYQYNIPNREAVKKIVLNKLFEEATKDATPRTFEYLERFLDWSKTGKEYVSLCTQIAVLGLDYNWVGDQFIKKLKQTHADLFMVAKLEFYHKHNMSINHTKPFLNTQGFNKIAFNKLMKMCTEQDRLIILNQTIQSIIFKLETAQELDAFVDLFNYLIKYYPETEVIGLFETMKQFANKLISLSHFEEAEIVLRKALSLNHNTYELCYLLAFCNCKASNLEELYKSPPLIENEYYNLALKLAFASNKKAYNELLDVYSAQKEYIEKENKRQKQFFKQQEEKKQLLDAKKQTKLASSLGVLGIIIHIIFVIIIGVRIFTSFEIEIVYIFCLVGIPLTIAGCILVAMKLDNDITKRLITKDYIRKVLILLVADIIIHTILTIVVFTTRIAI